MTNTAQNEFHKLIDKRERWVSVTQENDIDVEGILAGLYDDPSHFIFELLQNAEDESANIISFYLFNDRLEIHHDGEDFDFKDVEAITGIGKSTKKDELHKIGQFGVGFKSVFAITENPEIYSGEYAFRIKNFVVPEKLNNSLKSRTKIVLPFDHRIRGTKEVFNLVADRLKNIGETTLLFLENIQEINWFINNNEESGKYSRECKAKIFDHIRRIELQSQIGNNNIVLNQWLIFDKPVEKPACQDISSEITQNFKRKVEVAFRIKVDSKTSKELIIPVHNPKLVVFFPTGKETHLKFLIQGPYRTTPARDYIPERDSWNIMLRNETASLVADSLTKIKELGFFTTDFLNVLPINKENFPEDHMFRSVYEAVLSKLKSDEKLLPANDGSHISANQAFLAGVKDLIGLLNSKQLSLLFGKQDCQWLNSNITQDKTPELRKYLIDELEIQDITPDRFANQFTEEFMKEQDDEWVIRFYIFLKDPKALWRKKDYRPEGILRNKQFIRLENNKHVAPFDNSGKPQAYLPGSSNTGFRTDKTVKKVIADDKEAREFLEELDLPKLDIHAEVIESILPKYQKENIEISNDENLDDVKKIIQALKIIPSDRKEGLVNELKKSNFLIVVNPSVLHQKDWCKPDLIYLTERFTGSEILDKYFEGNPDIYFLDEMYNDFKSEQLLELGCLDNVRVTYRKPNYYGHIDIQNYRGHHKRGLNGFDPDCEIEGLEYALEHITVEKARIIWNILKKYYKSIYGTVESSARQDYGDRGYSSHKEKELASKMGELVREKKWLPDKQGNPHKPSEILLSDLLDDFDDKSTEAKFLAEKLGFNKDIEQEIRDRLPTEKQEIWDMLNSSDDEDIQAVKQLLDSRKKDKDKELTAYEDLNYKEELEQAFNCPQIKKPEEDHIPPDTIPDPNRRRELTQAEIQESIENEPPVSQRFKRVPDKIWEQKNNKVRPFLKEQYGGKCQICDYVFYKRDGEPYFEGSYFVSMTKASWIDKPGNVLCLCANCCAKFKHGQVEVDEILDQINNPKWINEDGTLYAIIKLKLCGEEVELKYSERHILYLQEILKASIKKTITKQTERLII